MKQHLLFLLVLLMTGSTTYAQMYTGTDADRQFPGAEKVYYKDAQVLPAYFKLNPGSTFSETALDQWLRQHLHTNPYLSVLMVRDQKDKTGETHNRYCQTYKGIPVTDANFITHASKGNVYAVNGILYDNIKTANQVVLSEQQALVSALHALSSDLYRWQVPGNGNLSYYPSGELVLYPDRSEESVCHRYAWVFDVYAVSPLKRVDIYIDAQTGIKLFENNRLLSTDTLGTAVTKYSGTQDVITDFFNEGFRLRESGRGDGIETYNMQTGTDYFSAVDFTDTDNYWDNVNAQIDEVATDAHWGAEMTYDYFFVKHNRNSIDDEGFMLKSYVHYDQSYANAFWDGEVMTYGDGDGSYNPFPALDICGHEITHGLTTFTADLVYAYESGALSEGYSDIFGTAIEFYAKPSMANWTCGEDIGVTIRSLIDPNSMGDPDTYQGDNWATGGGDNGGVHTNCNVLGHWFYLLSVGGSGTNDNGDVYNVTAIGLDHAAKIAFRTLTVYLGPGSDYQDARFYSIQSAMDLFGACTPEMESTANAFYAVGVGSPFNPTVIADFSSASASFCSLPAQVQFINNSNNGVNYFWEFGDGTTSTLFAPVHNYTNEGTYTVTLIVDGGDCGADSIVKMDYIFIDAPDTPVVTSASSCTGPTSLTLTAIAPDSVRWYTTPTGGTPFFTGTTYVTPVLNQSEHYYVENQIVQAPIFGAKPDNSGNGSNYSYNTVQYEIFDAYSSFIIRSVKVYAQGSGNRAISLRNSNGVTLTTVNAMILNGEQTVELNITVPAGTGWQLAGPPSADLFRNNDGLSYPYSLGVLGSITSSSAASNPLGRYYYFYNWEIEELPCTSVRLPVNAFINYGEPVAAFSFGTYPLYVVFQNTSTDGNDFLWDFGDGNTSTEVSPVHLYSAPGSYNVMLFVGNACGFDSVSHQVQVIATGMNAYSDQVSLVLSPVPANDNLQVQIQGVELNNTLISVYDLLGNLVQRINLGTIRGNYRYSMDVSFLSEGVYLLELKHDQGKISRRFVVK